MCAWIYSTAVGRPKIEAGFSIDMPFQNAGAVGDIVGLGPGFSVDAWREVARSQELSWSEGDLRCLLARGVLQGDPLSPAVAIRSHTG